MSATVEIKGLDALNEGIDRLIGLVGNDGHQAYDDIGRLGVQFIGSRIEEGKGDPETGEAWAALSDWYETEKKETSSGGILSFEGDLEDDIRHQVDGNEIIVGTNRVYAATMHFGAEKGEFGNGAPWGDIPARPFLGFTDDEAEEMLDVLNEHIDAELKR